MISIHFNGKINLIDRAVDPQTGSIKVRVVFPNGKDMLKPGMSGTLLVHRSSKDAVVIPYKAVTEQLGEFFVYVVNGDKVSQVKVQLGQPLGSNIIVKDGLKPGDVIVVQGVQNLREGCTDQDSSGYERTEETIMNRQLENEDHECHTTSFHVPGKMRKQ